MRVVRDIVRSLYGSVGEWYLRPWLTHEWRNAPRDEINERPIEYTFVLKWLWQLSPSRVLDVGTGMSAWPHLLASSGYRVTAVDRKARNWWRPGRFNRHYLVLDDDITASRLTEAYDAVTAISVVEHIPDHGAAMRGMFDRIRVGGHVLVTCPYRDDRYVENVYALPDAGYNRDAGYVCQVFSRAEVEGWVSENGGVVLAQEYYRIFSGDLWSFGARIHPPLRADRDEPHHLTCIVMQKG